MNWIRLALFGIIAAAAIAAALRWPGDIAANAIIPLTLCAISRLGVSAMTGQCTIPLPNQPPLARNRIRYGPATW